MKAHLMHADADFDAAAPDPAWAQDLEHDLELGRLFDAAGGDEFDRAVARTALLHPLGDAASIRYRQEAFEDCARNTGAVEAVFALSSRALRTEQDMLLHLMGDGPSPMRLQRAARILRDLLPIVRELRTWADAQNGFRSEALLGFLATVRTDLDDAALQRLDAAVGLLEPRDGLLFSARLGSEGQVVGQSLRRPRDANRRSLGRTPLKRPHVSFTLSARDEESLDRLADLQNRSLDDVAGVASRAVDHVLGFFRAVRTELTFYLGGLRLVARLGSIGVALSVPTVVAAGASAATATGLVDPGLALETGRAPVPSDIVLGGRRLAVITGANHGGKSTALRALGVAQLLMQAGLPVTATRFAAPIAGAVHTHWSKEEDVALTRGKLDDELARMRAIVDAIAPGDLLLLNESFSSTNEREGSEVALEIVTALLRAGVQIRLVTHLFGLASALRAGAGGEALFLRAPRGSGDAMLPLEEAPPAPTSWGVDLFDRVFGTHLADGPDGDQASGFVDRRVGSTD